MEANDYKEFCKLWTNKPNPSNQNFHNKMIRSLSINHDIDVLSIRPYSSKYCSVKYLNKEEKKTGNITWHYAKIKKNKISRYTSVIKEYKNAIRKKDLKDTVIIADTINPLCVSVASYIAKQKHIPVIGVCTDSPSNITSASRSYTLYLLNKASKFDGFITLTEELNDLYNEKEKPHIVIEGIVENNIETEPVNIKKPYIFFCGSLIKRYGVYDLIEAYKKLDNPNIDLYIAGHSGNMSNFNDAIKKNPNIHFLGTINVRDILNYEAHALVNVNPRPYSEDLDRYSIPSKTIEYLTSGVITISVRNSKLQPHFENEVYWINSSTPDEIMKALKDVIEMDEEERKAIGLKAKEKVHELYSLDQINQIITQFLANFSNN